MLNVPGVSSMRGVQLSGKLGEKVLTTKVVLKV